MFTPQTGVVKGRLVVDSENELIEELGNVLNELVEDSDVVS